MNNYIENLHDLYTLYPTVALKCADVCSAWSYGQWGYKYSRSLLEVVEDYHNILVYPVDLSQVWVYIKDDQPVGMIKLKDYFAESPDNKQRFWLSTLYVHENYRGKGIAKELHDTLVQWIADNTDEHYIHLYTSDAEAYYTKWGWETTGKTPENDPIMSLQVQN